MSGEEKVYIRLERRGYMSGIGEDIRVERRGYMSGEVRVYEWRREGIMLEWRGYMSG